MNEKKLKRMGGKRKTLRFNSFCFFFKRKMLLFEVLLFFKLLPFFWSFFLISNIQVRSRETAA